MKHLIIIGTGGYAREVYWHAQGSLGYEEEWDVKGFLDGDVKLTEEEYKKLSLPVLGDVNSYVIKNDDVFITAIAAPNVKKKLVGKMYSKGAKFINLIHKTAIVHGTAVLGVGNSIGYFCNINDHAKLGNHIILNGRVGIGHDASIGDYSSLMGLVNIAGWAEVGSGTFWGASSIGMPHSKVEDDAYVGVASVVFKRVKKGQKVFGNPALPI